MDFLLPVLSTLLSIFEKEDHKDLIIHILIYLLFASVIIGLLTYKFGDFILNTLSKYFIILMLSSMILLSLSAWISYKAFEDFYKKWENIVMNSPIEDTLDLLHLLITEQLSDIKEKILKGELRSELVENARILIRYVSISFPFYFFGMLLFLLGIICMILSNNIFTLNAVFILLPLIVLLSGFSLRKNINQEKTEVKPEEHVISSILNFSIGILSSPFYILKPDTKDKKILNFTSWFSYLWVLFPKTPKLRLKAISHYKVLDKKNDINKILDFFKSLGYEIEEIIKIDNGVEGISEYVSPLEIANVYKEIAEYLRGNKKSINKKLFAFYNLYLKLGKNTNTEKSDEKSSENTNKDINSEKFVFKGFIQVIKAKIISNSIRHSLNELFNQNIKKRDTEYYIMIIGGITLEDYYDDVREKIYMI